MRQSALLRFVLIGAIFALAGCSKPDDQVCASYGFTPGTDSFGSCMMQRQQMRMQAFQMIMQNQQQQQQNQQSLYQQQMQAIQNSKPVTTNTNCNSYGSTTNCASTTQ